MAAVSAVEVVMGIVVAVVEALSDTGGSGLIQLSGVRGRCINAVPGLMGDTVVIGRAINDFDAEDFVAAPAPPADLDVVDDDGVVRAAAAAAAGVAVAPRPSPALTLAFLRVASCAFARSCRLNSTAAAAFACP